MPMPRSQYPPEYRDKTRLEYYASLFNSLEVNSSFYKTPQAATVTKWAKMVPEDFRFTFKLSKEVTHCKGLEFNEKIVQPFMNAIDQVGDKNGCLLIQFPPSLHIEKINRLQDLLSEVKFYNEANWKMMVEFRHSSWYEREVFEILEEYDTDIVLHDIPASASPAGYLPREIAYLRYHGPEPRYRGSYSDSFLRKEAERIRAFRSAGKQVYCYFNNTMGDAVNNLQTLIKLEAGKDILPAY